MVSFADRLTERIARTGSVLVVGLDPLPGALPPELVPSDPRSPSALGRSFVRLSMGILEAVADLVAAVKFQSAFYERLGRAGLDALCESLAHAWKLGLLTILDVKRADIGSTAEAYAEAYLGDVPETCGPDSSAGLFLHGLGNIHRQDALRPPCQ